jgi:hypothetical protein
MASKDSEARLRAEEKFAKAQRRETDIMNGQRQLWQAEADKLVRLRALRLAKEAAEGRVPRLKFPGTNLVPARTSPHTTSIPQSGRLRPGLESGNFRRDFQGGPS